MRKKVGVVLFFVRNLNCGGASWALLTGKSADSSSVEDLIYKKVTIRRKLFPHWFRNVPLYGLQPNRVPVHSARYIQSEW